MKILSKVILGTSCLTIFTGTAYVVAVSLAPPPSYTVSNADRIRSYDKLAVNGEYEKKTRSQEFMLGLSRWRRRILKDEGLLKGRVLEVGAGCGGNLAYYPHNYFTDDEDIKEYVGEIQDGVAKSKGEAESHENKTSYILQHMRNVNSCDEVILCDRSSCMVDTCTQRIQKRLGYTPFRYPDYDIERIRATIAKRHELTQHSGPATKDTPSKPAGAVLRKRKVVRGDGSVEEILTTPLFEDEEVTFLESATTGSATNTVPILQELMPGDRLPLLSHEGERELKKREALIAARQQLRLQAEHGLQREEERVVREREAREAAARKTMGNPTFAADEGKGGGVKRAGSTAPALPPILKDESGKGIAKQPLFSVANYAAEQLPFPDNSFDTVVDMFGLCSYDDPVRALRELSRVCKPGGQMLLIEHGRGSATRVNAHLDKWAPRHAKSWGCWWNRDIRRIVRLSGLTIEKWDDKHFGTSHYIVAKPYKTMEEWDAYTLSER